MKSIARSFVASGHPTVSSVAAEILAMGGNAFDAAVGAGFASAIAEPALTSLGGGGFLLGRTGAGEEILFDFFVDTPGLGRDTDQLVPHFFPVTIRFPGANQDFNVGLGSVAVPGNLKGFLHVHHRLGTLPLARILAPTIRLAREGVTINSSQGYFLSLLRPILTLTGQGRELYQPAGTYLGPGKKLRNTDLALFLENLPGHRGESFYSGEIAYRIARDMEEGDGLLTYDDLASFQVIERKPLAVTTNGSTLLTNPPPSMGGSLIGHGLSRRSSLNPRQGKWNSREHALGVAATLIEMEDIRTRNSPDHSIPESRKRLRTFSRGTTHISVADGFGNVASMTTSNGEGSGYIVPSTGIMLNNMMGEDDLHPEGFHASPPGQRVASMMSPSILLKGDRVRLALGSGGSKRIRSAIVQVLINVLECGMEIEEAVKTPRIHWDGKALQVEPGYGDDVVAALKEHWPVNLWPELDMYFGGVHAVAPGRGGGGDPRRGGAVAVVDHDRLITFP